MSVPPRWATALAALALAVFGIAQAVYWQAGEATYRDLAGARTVTLSIEGGVTWQTDSLIDVHRQTLAYLLDQTPDQARCCGGLYVFDPAERSHLADVRGVFRGLRVAQIAAGLVLIALLVRGRMRGYALRLLRGGALWSAAGVLVVGVIAAVAFEPAFLAFHYVFFPQGNFLFDPATSNLLRVYPEPYWYGVTLRVGATFAMAMVLIAAATSLTIRRRGAPRR